MKAQLAVLRLASAWPQALLLALPLAAAMAFAVTAARAEPYNPSRLPAQQLGQVGQLCRGVIGVKPGFTLYDNCVEALSSVAATRPATLTRIDDTPPKPAASPYFRASFAELRRREQDACGRLGYDAGSGGFAACVAGLDAALYAADHPQP